MFSVKLIFQYLIQYRATRIVKIVPIITATYTLYIEFNVDEKTLSGKIYKNP